MGTLFRKGGLQPALFGHIRRGRLQPALQGPPEGGPYIRKGGPCARKAGSYVVVALVMALSAAVLAQGGGAAQGGRGRATAAPASTTTTRTTTTLTSPVTGNAVAGKKLYYEHACYSCHGYSGETGARAFVPNWPANLATERSFIAFLRGRANVAPLQPSTSMPNYPVESLSDAQAKDVYAYIRSFSSTPPPLEKIPTMTQILSAAQKPYKK